MAQTSVSNTRPHQKPSIQICNGTVVICVSFQSGSDTIIRAYRKEPGESTFTGVNVVSWSQS